MSRQMQSFSSRDCQKVPRTRMKRNLKSSVSDSTVSPGWQNVASSSNSANSECCFEVVEPGLNSAEPPEGGFVDLNATCSHDSRTLSTGVLASCDMPAARFATVANRTLFIRSLGGLVGMGRGVGSDLMGRRSGRNGQSTTHHHCHLSMLLLLLFSYCSSRWTLSHKLRIL